MSAERVFCAQCDRFKHPSVVAACTSPFCTAKGAAPAPRAGGLIAVAQRRAAAPPSDPARRARLVKLYEDNLTLRQIGDREGISYETVRKILADAGCRRRRGSRPGVKKPPRADGWTQERIFELDDLIADGLTFAEVGERMGLTRNAVAGQFNRIKASMGWQAQ